MRTVAGRLGIPLVLAALLAGAAVPACAATAPADTVPDLAVVPFANNSGLGEARDLLMPMLEELLRERGYDFVTAGALRPLLREHRVRTRGWIGRRGAAMIARETGARYLLLGSWDVFKRQGNLEVGLSLRILDLKHMALVHAVSVGGTGEDSVGLLDLGRVTDMEVLARTVMEEALDQLIPFRRFEEVAPSWRGCNHVAVIPLDDFSAQEHAGDTVTNILLSRLLAAGYFVVEPGFVRELGLAREVVSRGGVDRASAQAILDSLGACQVITGAVQRFDPARGLPTVSVPQFAAGIRASSTRNGALYLMRELERAGNQGEGIFQLGRQHAIVPLVSDRLDKFVADLRKANRKDIIHGP